jgi:acyl-coenzyme A synthetase/AMP-(fatty) acid ligase/3-hydroxymyristoyl/3-hydroxydecanoyl-(acyl carrier protein) dehydratase
LISGLLLGVFGFTLFSPPSMIFRFATFQDKSIVGSLAEKRVEGYCRKVTLVWCGFFILNGGIASYTIFSGSDILWSIYNGGISYILMGLLFAGEFIIRKKADKKMPKAFPLSKFKENSRSPDTILMFEGIYGDGVYKTWRDFLADTARLRRVIQETPGDTWLLHCEDCWYFLNAFTALLQCKKKILLTANISPGYIAEIRGPGTPVLTDQVFPEHTLHIPSLLEGAPEIKTGEIPVINADETAIVMYTSGSTGKPKAVLQRLTEFEADNRFILSKWGEEFLRRRLCSTVSQHHIYGLLFSILLPFTAGVPFRRQRVQFPEEFEKFNDDEYMIITVPAFLKRAVEIEGPGTLSLRSPWIFTSGGVLAPETAKKTWEAFGFWPVEVYGSTETSGIAWRQSKDGLEWTPFDNAHVSLNEEGCLVIRSPYIKDPAGFVTADMADILADGRFLLKGRIDSVVKIEEKRISLPEIENRILQSGLAADVCVVPMEEKRQIGVRQYLAAAVVFNEAGKDKFGSWEKHEINRYFREYLLQFFENLVIPKKWRYLDVLPVDPQGKKKRPEIQDLFAGANGILGETILKKTETSVSLEFTVTEESPYFDGHFPEIKILPAAAQFDLVVHFASRYLGTGLRVSGIKRIKFPSVIRPGIPLVLNLSYDKDSQTLSFKTSGAEGETIYSSGSLVLGGTQ